MRRPGEAVELHQGPVTRQLPGLRLPDSSAGKSPGGPRPNRRPPVPRGRHQTTRRPEAGADSGTWGRPTSVRGARLAPLSPPSLPGNFGASRHKLAVRRFRAARGEGRAPSRVPPPRPPQGALAPTPRGPPLPSPGVEEGSRERGGAGAAPTGRFQRAARPRRCHAKPRKPLPQCSREAGPSL